MKIIMYQVYFPNHLPFLVPSSSKFKWTKKAFFSSIFDEITKLQPKPSKTTNVRKVKQVGRNHQRRKTLKKNPKSHQKKALFGETHNEKNRWKIRHIHQSNHIYYINVAVTNVKMWECLTTCSDRWHQLALGNLLVHKIQKDASNPFSPMGN